MTQRKEKLFLVVFGVFVFAVLALALRGVAGNPASADLNTSKWKEDGPLELSPDRGRFALTYSLLEDHSFQYSLPVARFTAPDVAYLDGKYVSLFAPGVSFVMMPGYLIGKQFGLAQVGASAMITFFATLNAILIVLIAMRLGVPKASAMIGALVFVFASPAFTYAVTLYQHHISTFLILSCIYLLLASESVWATALIWFLIVLSLSVDYPNFFMMFPVGVVALLRFIFVQQDDGGFVFTLRFRYLLSFVGIVLPMIFFFWFNWASYGNPLQLSGTLSQATAIDDAGKPIGFDLNKAIQSGDKHQAQELLHDSTNKSAASSGRDKTAVGFFKTRAMLNGFYMHFISPDRGMIWFTPVLFFGILGFVFLYRRNRKIINLMIAIAGVNILLYSMWGDPYGGWAFGSRYLVPVYALLGIGVAEFCARFRTSYLILGAFVLIATYSLWVNVLGAITSSRNPPKVEVLTLEKISGHQEKYSYDRNLQFLHEHGSKSFVFDTYASRLMSPEQYHAMLTTLIFAMLISLLGMSAFEKELYAHDE